MAPRKLVSALGEFVDAIRTGAEGLAHTQKLRIDPVIVGGGRVAVGIGSERVEGAFAEGFRRNGEFGEGAIRKADRGASTLAASIGHCLQEISYVDISVNGGLLSGRGAGRGRGEAHKGELGIEMRGIVGGDEARAVALDACVHGEILAECARRGEGAGG